MDHNESISERKIQLWEIKNHSVPLVVNKSQPPSASGRVKVLDFDPTWDSRLKQTWAAAELLANDGWELVSFASETCARMTVGDGSEGIGCVGSGFRAPSPVCLRLRERGHRTSTLVLVRERLGARSAL